MKPAKTNESTPNLVLAALRKSKKPLSAYDILDKLKKQGVKSPPLVYRALESLTRKGTAHRIDALSSYVACSCKHKHHHALSVLTVCGVCESVEEIHDEKIIHHLETLREFALPLTENAVIELPVVCKNCV